MLAPYAVLLLAFGASSLAQFPSQDANTLNLTVVHSPADENITISYKEPLGVCKTAFDTQKQYTGWVNIPGDYPTNLFFWFVEAREKTDILTIWLNGGPGSSSMLGFFAGNGPCEVVEMGMDKYDTIVREWGWDRASNMIFIDQPNQVGFSYDTPTNGTMFLPRGSVKIPPVPAGDYAPLWAQLNGTFSSMQTQNTVNTTETAAMAVWHMVQGFLTTFPQYTPKDNSSVAVNLFAESYGGRYGPIFAETWEEQNDKRSNGQLDKNKTVDVHLSSLGIVNGCVDEELQVPFYPDFAVNNTYGFEGLSEKMASFYKSKFDGPNGCKEKLKACADAVSKDDPDGEGDEDQVNRMCQIANEACLEIQSAYYTSGRSAYDLASPFKDPFPAMRFLDYVNQAEVQQAIGTRTNYTLSSTTVFKEFLDTGDQARGGNIKRLAELVQRGVRVGLMYGDRDYICNWLGGEAVSLGVAAAAGPDYADKFPAAGYAPVAVNDSYVGGVVRQYGNLSFSRIYQAGHAVPWYQPETSFQVFARIMMGKSVSTGEAVDLSGYNTTGSAKASHTDKLPPMPDTTCYIRAFGDTCSSRQQNAAANGDGVIINGIWYNQEEDWPLASDHSAGPSKTKATNTQTMTGVYTATKTPSEDAANSNRVSLWTWSLLIGLVGAQAIKNCVL